MIRLASLLGLIGLAGVVALILEQGLGAVAAALAGSGFGVLWVSLFHLVPMLLNARAWQALLPGTRRPHLGFFLWLVWVREAVNGLLPVARIGGEVATARLLMGHGIRGSSAATGLLVELSLAVASQLVFTLAGILWLALRGGLSSAPFRLLLVLLVAVPVVVVVWAVRRLGVAELLVRLVRAFAVDRRVGAVATAVATADRYDRAVWLTYRRPDRGLACFLWQLAGWTAGGGEIWLALACLGHPVGLGDALMVEALIQAVGSAAFLVPAAIGVQECGFLLIGALIGLPATPALALALMRRARDLLLFAPALAAWQLIEGRRQPRRT